MLKVLFSLATLITAASLVNLVNSTMTTVMPLRMLEDGASTTMVALFGASYFLGFAVGCFSQPPVILRIGYIRAFAAAAGACTMLAVVMDQSNSVMLWLSLRFLMGLALAAIFAAVDGWINGTTPDAMRGTVFSTYGWRIGASATLGQVLLVGFEGMEIGFITILALAFNLGLILVAMTSAVAPPARSAPEGEGNEAANGRERLLVFTSSVSVATAIYAGLVATAILSILPALLAEGGIDDSAIGAAIGAFLLGRLLLQIPLGIIADRMDQRLLVAILAGLTGFTTLIGTTLVLLDAAHIAPDVGWGRQMLFLTIMMILGGLVLPLYTLANSLAFARAGGEPPVRIATSLLLVNSVGAIAGPLLVAAALPHLGGPALPLVIIVASALMMALALGERVRISEPAHHSAGLPDIPTTSVALNGTMAEVKFTELALSDEPKP